MKENKAFYLRQFDVKTILEKLWHPVLPKISNEVEWQQLHYLYDLLV